MTARASVVVAGGGPSGAAAALVLARAGRSVTLVDDGGPPGFKIGEALPPAARPLLTSLGLWPRVAGGDHLPCYGNRSSWGGSVAVDSDFIFDPNGHGWRLDRARFDASLREAAREAGAAIVAARVIRATRAGERWEIALDRDHALGAEWIIDATGRRASIARAHGAERIVSDALTACFGRFTRAASFAGADADARTLVEAVADGWWYSALVPSGERVVAFLFDADLIDRSVFTTEGFLARLGQTLHVRDVLARAGYSPRGCVRGADASSARLDCVYGEGWAACGDAAISFDPLSSQGILTALHTGVEAARAVNLALDGERQAFAPYAKRVRTIEAAYVAERRHIYQMETRFSDRGFWRRRGTT